MKFTGFFTLAALIFLSAPATAQEISGNFTGGSVLVGYDTATCNAGRDGALRFNSSTNVWNYCDGAAWTAFNASLSYPLLANPIGTAVAPAYSFNGDANTGLYSPGADILALTVGGTTGSGDVIRFTSTSGAVNYLTIAGGTAAAAPTITTAGATTNGAGLGINIVGKDATAAGIGGGLTLSAGDSNGNNAGGTVLISGGDGGGTTGVGGAVTVQGGGAVTGGTNIAGGDLLLSSGKATGNGGSDLQFQVVARNQGTGTTARNPVTRMTLRGHNPATSNATELHIETEGASGGVLVDAYGGYDPLFLGRSANGPKSSPTAAQAGVGLVMMGGRGYGTTGWGATSSGAIQIRATENFTDTAQGAKITFETRTTGTVAPRQERMVIADNGVGIGLASFGDVPADLLHIGNGDIRIDGAAGNQAGCLRYNDTSDRLQYSHNCSTYTNLGAPPTCTRRTATTSTAATTVSCTGSEVMTGGGCMHTSTTFTLEDSGPTADTTWSCEWSAAGATGTAYAICCDFP